MLNLTQTLTILREAASRLPQLRFAWGLLGLAAISALIIRLLGENQAAVVVISLTLIGTGLVFVASVAFGTEAIARAPAQALIWSVTLFFIFFLSFTVTAFAFSWPCNWASFLGISTPECTSKWISDSTANSEKAHAQTGDPSGKRVEETNLTSAQKTSVDITTINGRPFRNATQEAQYLLNLLGYSIPHADGLEGPMTTFGLQQFQKDHNLPMSGTADDNTLAVLRSRAKKKFLVMPIE